MDIFNEPLGFLTVFNSAMGFNNPPKSIHYSHEWLSFICSLSIFSHLSVAPFLTHSSETDVQKYVAKSGPYRTKPETPLRFEMMAKDITRETVRRLHLRSAEGVVITKILLNGTEASAGLQAKDLIQKLTKEDNMRAGFSSGNKLNPRRMVGLSFLNWMKRSALECKPES